MTRKRLMEITSSLGLALDMERVTTGPPDGAAFRQFEFTHPDRDALMKACKEIRHEWADSPYFVAVHLPDNDKKPYLLVSSFYCEPGAMVGEPS